MPGGVNSPVRAFGSVGGSPVFIKKAQGAWLWDEDDNRYVDFISSWGPAIVGHAHPEVVEAVQKVVVDGFSFGAPTERENILAARICEALPAVEMVRFVSSGTEACMSALRVARAFTKRTKVLKFEGCYHGHADFLLVKPGSGVATLGLSGSPGVPESAARDTLTCPYNDLAAVEECFERCGAELAAVILEPVVGNAGFIRPSSGFLELLRKLCDQHGTVLIFDEVMTGFRVAWGGFQNTCGIRPDMTVLGKVIGGGMPVGAYGGKREIMSLVAPAGPVYQAGTLSGNPVAMACGTKTLEILSRSGSTDGAAWQPYERLSLLSNRLMVGMQKAASDFEIPFQVDYEGGMFGFFFCDSPVANFADAKKSDLDRFRLFFHAMLDAGFYFAPSAFEAGFLSLAHTEDSIDQTIAASKNFFAALKRGDR